MALLTVVALYCGLAGRSGRLPDPMAAVRGIVAAALASSRFGDFSSTAGRTAGLHSPSIEGRRHEPRGPGPPLGARFHCLRCARSRSRRGTVRHSAAVAPSVTPIAIGHARHAGGRVDAKGGGRGLMLPH